jgi:DNA-directed RNA polymerase subunit RPC12/RpoP
MPYRCRKCGQSTVRISQFRLKDIVRLILLQSPVRCRTCRNRYYVSLSDARSIRNELRAGK